MVGILSIEEEFTDPRDLTKVKEMIQNGEFPCNAWKLFQELIQRIEQLEAK